MIVGPLLMWCGSMSSGRRESSWYGWSKDLLQPNQAPHGRSLLPPSVSNLIMLTHLIFYGKHVLNPLLVTCRSQKFEDPAEGEETLVEKFKKLHEDLTNGFRALEDETR